MAVPGKDCNGATNEYKSLEQCCAKSFTKSSGPIRGSSNGDSRECYLAPGVLDPPCWLADTVAP
jgi:hypothetical protein